MVGVKGGAAEVAGENAEWEKLPRPWMCVFLSDLSVLLLSIYMRDCLPFIDKPKLSNVQMKGYF